MTIASKSQTSESIKRIANNLGISLTQQQEQTVLNMLNQLTHTPSDYTIRNVIKAVAQENTSFS